MITSATAFLSEMADSDICFVKVVECVEKSSDITKFKTVSVVEEIGYWLRTFHFNIFANHCLYDDIQEGMSLKVKVRFFSRKYRTLLEAAEVELTSCNICRRYTDNISDSCIGCQNETAIRVKGNWKLVKKHMEGASLKLYFQQENEMLCCVVFNGMEECYQVGTVSTLTGWQKLGTRHNAIIMGKDINV